MQINSYTVDQTTMYNDGVATTEVVTTSNLQIQPITATQPEAGISTNYNAETATTGATEGVTSTVTLGSMSSTTSPALINETSLLTSTTSTTISSTTTSTPTTTTVKNIAKLSEMQFNQDIFS
jgi:hypothetical protein